MKKLVLSFIVSMLVLITVLPPIEAMPSLGIFNTPLGIISFQKVLFIVIITIISVYILRYGKIRVTSNDIVIYLLVIFSLLNTEDFSSLAYFVLVMLGSYTVGRFFGEINSVNYLLKYLKAIGLIEVIVIMFSVFLGVIFFQPTTGYLFNEFKTCYDCNGSFFVFSNRVTGTIGHPVTLGALLVPSFFAWYFVKNGNQKKLFKYIMLSLLFFSIILTFSRGSWIAFFLTFLILFVREGYYKIARNLIIISLILLVIIFSPVGQDIISRLSITNITDISVSHRLYMITWAFNIIGSNVQYFLFGTGVGSVSSLLDRFPPNDGIPVVDNIYISILLEYGIIGVFLFFIIIFRALYGFFFRYYYDSDKSFYYILISLLVVGLTFDFFYWIHTGTVFWLLIGYLSTKKVNFNKKLLLK